MTRRRALEVVSTAACVATVALSGCASSSGRGPLILWALGIQGENSPRLMPPFERATGLRVRVETLPWTGAHAKLLTAYAGRSLPDVVMVPNIWLAELAMLGAIVPATGQSNAEDEFAGAAAAVVVDGRTVGMPWFVDTWVQFYRPDLLAAVGYDAPPADWARWRAMALAIKRRTPDRFAVLMLLDWPEFLFAFAAQQPDPLLRDGMTRGNFSSAGFREVLRFYKGLFDDRLSPAVVGREIGDSILAFRDGYFAILPSNSTTAGDFRLARLPDNLWRTAPMPGPAGIANGLATGSSLCVTRDARDPAAAWSLVRFLGSAATQVAFHAITGNLPSRPSAWSAPALADYPPAQVLRSQIVRAPPPPQVPEWQRITVEVQSIAERMVRGVLSVDAAAAAMDTRVDQLLEKRRWLLDRQARPAWTPA